MNYILVTFYTIVFEIIPNRDLKAHFISLSLGIFMTNRFMAMIGLRGNQASLGLSDLSHAVMEITGSPKFVVQESKHSPLGPTRIVCHSMEFALIYINQPIPKEALVNAYEESSLLWPSAPADFIEHRSHIAISTLENASSREEFIEEATLLTIIAGAIADLTNAVGVFWSAAESLVPKESVIEAAQLALNGELPISQWVRFSFRPGRNKGIGVFTQGLEPFIGREIEFPPNPALSLDMMLDRINGLAHYLVHNGLVIDDQDTVGVTEDECIRVIYGTSHIRPGTPILKLRIENSEPA